LLRLLIDNYDIFYSIWLVLLYALGKIYEIHWILLDILMTAEIFFVELTDYISSMVRFLKVETACLGSSLRLSIVLIFLSDYC